MNGNRKNWNEFQWENEIRRDERRISCYFRELPLCLDLPGEEDIIFDNLSARPDMALKWNPPEGNGHLHPWEDRDDDEDSARDDNAENEPFPGGANPLWRIDQLAAEWNVVAASHLDHSADAEILAVSCAFGKLLGRMTEFLEPGDGCDNALRISLGKRSLRDLNELYGMLGQVLSQLPQIRDSFSWPFLTLSSVREQIIEFLGTLRNEKNSR